MKSLLFLTFLIASPAIHAQGDLGSFVPPEKPRAASYRSLWEQSPFTEKEVIVTEEGPGFAENLVLEGIMSLGGEDVACIVDTTTDEVLYVRASEPTRGITLVEIKNRTNIDQASVTLASGSERSTLTFSEEKLVVGPNASPMPNMEASNQMGNAQPDMSNQVPNKSPRIVPVPTNQLDTQNNPELQQVNPANVENTTLTEEQMRERRRQFWESMRDRRSRGGR